MKQIPFVKMDGLGNDFVIIDERKTSYALTEKEIVAIADRRTGVGFDQMIVLTPSSKAFAKISFYNADGSTAGACGNGTRCTCRLLMDETGGNEVVLEGPDGRFLAGARAADGLTTVNMGRPKTAWDEIPLTHECDTLKVEGVLPELGAAVCVSMGNPHAVFFVPDAEKTDIERLGPVAENHPMFPQRANIEFASVVASDLIRMRVWERGAGVTEACGSGACATLVAAVRAGLSDEKAEIRMDGGSLIIEWRDKGDVLMTGATHEAFRGVLFV